MDCLVQFEWDGKKSKLNSQKHKVSFDEASTVFYDENALDFFDPDHSENEEKFILLGMSRGLRLLIISYCYRKSDTIIRIISARKADNFESQDYWKKG